MQVSRRIIATVPSSMRAAISRDQLVRAIQMRAVATSGVEVKTQIVDPEIKTVSSSRSFRTGRISSQSVVTTTLGTDATTALDSNDITALEASDVTAMKSIDVTALEANDMTATNAMHRPVKEFSEIPGPKPWPILGNLVQIFLRKDFNPKKLYIVGRSLMKQYGNILKVELPLKPNMVITQNPDDLEVYLKSTMNNPIRYQFKALKHIRDHAPGNYFNKKAGIIVENGEEWWRLRRRVQGPLLKPRSVSSYLPVVEATALEFIDRIEVLQKETGHVPDNFLEELYKWGLESVALIALNRRLGCLESTLPENSLPLQMISLINKALNSINDTEMGLHTWMLYKNKAYRDLERAHNAFIKIADEVIQDAIRKAATKDPTSGDDASLGVIEAFLQTEGVSRSDITTLVVDMLMAGVDTSSNTAAFALYFLARNRRVQEKLQSEIGRVVGDAPRLLPSHLEDLVYLQNIIKETLRLYPVTGANTRIMVEDVVLSGYKVPKGTLVMGVYPEICRKEAYFQRPLEFLPERWERQRPFGHIHPFASLPFNHGKRICIGKRIAEQELYTLLIRLFQKFDVSLNTGQKMRVRTQLVLRPDIPLPFTFSRRE